MSNAILSKSKFIHIPKCGGTAIQSVLWNIGCIKNHSQSCIGLNYGHLYPSQMPNDGKINFAFIRNPITWWRSWYWWNKTQPLSRFNSREIETESFDQWINEYGQSWLGMFTMQVKRYLGEDENFPSTNKVTLIGKSENLYTDLKTILNKIGENYNEAALDLHINQKISLLPADVNIQKYNREDISIETRKIIYQTEREIFDRFDYDINASIIA
jgi:hypothetical protein